MCQTDTMQDTTWQLVCWHGKSRMPFPCELAPLQLSCSCVLACNVPGWALLHVLVCAAVPRRADLWGWFALVCAAHTPSRPPLCRHAPTGPLCMSGQARVPWRPGAAQHEPQQQWQTAKLLKTLSVVLPHSTARSTRPVLVPAEGWWGVTSTNSLLQRPIVPGTARDLLLSQVKEPYSCFGGACAPYRNTIQHIFCSHQPAVRAALYASRYAFPCKTKHLGELLSDNMPALAL